MVHLMGEQQSEPFAASLHRLQADHRSRSGTRLQGVNVGGVQADDDVDISRARLTGKRTGKVSDHHLNRLLVVFVGEDRRHGLPEALVTKFRRKCHACARDPMPLGRK